MKSYKKPTIQMIDLSALRSFADGFIVGTNSKTVGQGGQWTRKKQQQQSGVGEKIWENLE